MLRRVGLRGISCSTLTADRHNLSLLRIQEVHCSCRRYPDLLSRRGRVDKLAGARLQYSSVHNKKPSQAMSGAFLCQFSFNLRLVLTFVSFRNPKIFQLLGLKDRPQFNFILLPHQMAKKLPSPLKRWASHTMLIRSIFPKAFSSRYFVLCRLVFLHWY